jgi:hypothetical protein
MTEVLDVYDGGNEIVDGHLVGRIVFKIVTNEGKPEEIIGFCIPGIQTFIIRDLQKRLMIILGLNF